MNSDGSLKEELFMGARLCQLNAHAAGWSLEKQLRVMLARGDLSAFQSLLAKAPRNLVHTSALPALHLRRCSGERPGLCLI